MKLLIIDTGGTFNKVYNPISGTLDIKTKAIFKILESTHHNLNIKIIQIIAKDSLFITKQDRQLILREIQKSKIKKILIIHGTDTINKTAKFLSKKIQNREIILTGAMQPFSIEPIESSFNIGLAIGFLSNSKNKNKIFITMNGFISPFYKIKKIKKRGFFKIR